MKILLIHNRYKEPGGEDVVFESESELLASHGHLVEQLIFHNSTIKTFLDSALAGLKGIYNTASAKAVSKKIEEFGPDIIHVHNFFLLVSPSVFFVAKKYNIPVIHTLHNYRLVCPSRYLFHKGQIYEKSIHSVFPLQAILKGVYRNSKLQTAAIVAVTSVHTLLGTWKNKVDFYIALSNFAINIFKSSKLGIPEERLAVKHNFIQDLGIGNSVRENFFLFIGRLSEEKGIRPLLRATRLGSFSLVIIGDGPMRNLVIDAATKNPNITYVGFQNRRSISDYLKKCTALIFPSIWYEGYPLTVLEAFSTGTPVIASKLGVMTEMIETGRNGLLFEAGNERNLIEKIEEIRSTPELAKRLGNNARQTYLTHFTPEKNYHLLIRIYNKALALKRQRSAKLLAHGSVPVFTHTKRL